MMFSKLTYFIVLKNEMINKSINFESNNLSQYSKKGHSITVNNPTRYYKHMRAKQLNTNNEYSYDFNETNWFLFNDLKSNKHKRNNSSKSNKKRRIKSSNRSNASNRNTVKAFIVTPHEMWKILVINVFKMIFIA